MYHSGPCTFLENRSRLVFFPIVRLSIRPLVCKSPVPKPVTNFVRTGATMKCAVVECPFIEDFLWEAFSLVVRDVS